MDDRTIGLTIARRIVQARNELKDAEKAEQTAGDAWTRASSDLHNAQKKVNDLLVFLADGIIAASKI